MSWLKMFQPKNLKLLHMTQWMCVGPIHLNVCTPLESVLCNPLACGFI